MNHRTQTASETTLGGIGDKVRPIKWEQAGRPLRAHCAWRRVSIRCGFAFRIVGQNARPEALCEFYGIRGRGEFLPAQSHDSLRRVGGHGCRNIVRNPADIGILAAVGFAGKRDSAGHVWNGNGDLFRTQVADGLFGFFCLRRVCLAGTARLRGEEQTSLQSLSGGQPS